MKLEHRVTSWLAGLLLAAAAGWVVYVHQVVPVLPFDDAFITYRYAENLAAGKGAVYNPGERVFGSSTPLYLLWVSALRAGGFGRTLPELAVRSNGLWLLFAGLAAYLLVARLSGSRLLASFAALCVVLNRSMLVVSSGGMESFLFVGLVLLALWALSAARPALFGLLAGLALLTRPEGVLLLPLGLIAYRRRALAKALLVWSVVVGLWVVLATLYYGSPIPHSIIAKLQPIYTLPRGIAVDLVRVGVAGLMTDLWSESSRGATSALVWALLVLATLAGLAAQPARRQAAWAPGAFLFGMLALYLVGNPMIFPWYWPQFFIPSVVILLVGLPQAGRLAEASLRRRGLRWARLPVPVALAVAVLLVGISLLSPYARGPRGPWSVVSDVGESPERLRVVTYRRVAEGLNRLAAADHRLAAPEIGSLGYYFKGHILDGCGLVTPEAIPFLPVPESERPHQANGAISLEFVQATAPDWVATLPIFARYSLLASDWFEEHYRRVGRAPLAKELWSSHEVLIFQRRVDGFPVD